MTSSENDTNHPAKTPRGLFIEDLETGMSAEYTRTVTQADIAQFAELSGDNNPVHLDEAYAAQTLFKGRISHGVLTASYISTVIGTKLPGPGAIYLSQQLKFLAPVRPGDTVLTRATITEINPEKRRITLETVCTVSEKPVLKGEAVIMVPSRSGE